MTKISVKEGSRFKLTIVGALKHALLVAGLLAVAPAAFGDEGAAADRLAAAQLRFGAAMIRDLAPSQLQGAEKSLVLSPYSLHSALALTREGARGETATQLANLLKMNADDALAYGALNNLVAVSSKETTVAVANSVWVSKGLGLREAFLQAAQQRFGALARPLDFSQASAATDQINAWVSEKTKRLIPKLLQEPLSPATMMVLANATYANASWDSPFYPSATQDGEFWLGPQGSTKVPMLRRSSDELFWQDEAVQALTIGLGAGSLQYTIILPSTKLPAPEVAALLTPERLQGATSGGVRRAVELRMPKAELRSRPILTAALAKTAPLPFSAGADFRNMTAQDSMISDVLHETVVKIDERGIEAAAATAVVVSRSAALRAPQSEPVLFVVDRPFAFVLSAGKAKAPLFIGVVADPRK